jgi:hypothetical protein
MKKIILAALMCIAGAAYALPNQLKDTVLKDSKCEYKLSDAQAGLKNMTRVAFVPRHQSEDGIRTFGFFLYHNPTNANAKSIDAMTLVLLDKRVADKQLTLMVVYRVGSNKSLLYVREMKDDGKLLSPCFSKRLEDNPTQSE